MSYDLHITRAEIWSESERNPITAHEWLSLVAADPELRLDGVNGPYFAVWSGPCSYPEGAWFDWADGCINTSSPDRPILEKMLRIASQLRATIQGDDGEAYTCADDLPGDDPPIDERRPWWRFWK